MTTTDTPGVETPPLFDELTLRAIELRLRFFLLHGAAADVANAEYYSLVLDNNLDARIIADEVSWRLSVIAAERMVALDTIACYCTQARRLESARATEAGPWFEAGYFRGVVEMIERALETVRR